MARILIIDDESQLRSMLRLMLERVGYEVIEAEDGMEGIRQYRDNPADLIITDLKMSSLGGMEVLRRVKESFPVTVVIVITGYSTVSSAVEVMKSGAFDYLPKPFTPHELRAVVMQALAEKRYEGWVIVEAEQDPVKADPYEYACIGYQALKKAAEVAGYTIAP